MSFTKWTVMWVIGFALPGFVLGGSLLGWAVAAPPGSQPEIAWVQDLDQAIQLAKTNNKPLMIHFYGDHCPPCRMLEAKAFRNRELVSVLNDNVIAVKVNADKQRDVAQRYQVNRWPTDVYVFPDGRVLERGVSNQDPQAYARTVERVSQRHRDWTLAQVAATEAQLERERKNASRGLSALKTKIASDAATNPHPVKISSATWKQNDSEPSKPAPELPSVKVIQMQDPVAQPSTDPSLEQVAAPNLIKASEAAPPQPKTEDPRAQQLQVLASITGLGGYCPVALQDFLRLPPQAQSTRSAWVPGSETFSVKHRGRVYHCSSEQARARLLKEPDLFAPVLSGCDLVEFARTGDLVSGRCEFGFIEQKTGRVFLFASRANYEEFARHCEQYSAAVSDPSKERVATDPTTPTRR